MPANPTHAANVLDASLHQASDSSIECRVSWGSNAFPLIFSSPTALAGDRIGDALLCALLLPAMAIGSELRIGPPVSPGLLSNVARLQDIFCSWWSDLRPVPVTTRTRPPITPTTHRSAVFFTAGVDSFYSAITVEPSPDALIYVEGYDVRLDNAKLLARVTDRLQRCAAEMGAVLWRLQTNYRDFLEQDRRFPAWARAHGGALASMAHLAASTSVVVPATDACAYLPPLGSHPLTDPLWSSDDVRVVHHGTEMDRISKCRYLAGHPAAMRHLRVCWRNPENAYNCGCCEKCLRTMINLHAAGALERCDSLPHDIPLRMIERMKLDRHGVIFLQQNLLRLQETDPADRQLANALRKALRRHQSGDFRKRMRYAFSW